MAGVEFRFEFDTSKADLALDRMLLLGENPFPFLDEVGGELASSTQQRFDDQAGPDGQAWKPSQRALATGGKTLKKSGILVGGITHEPTSDYVDVGSGEVYAAIQNLGGQAGRNNATEIDARPYLGISAEDEKMIEDMAFEFIEDAAGV